MTVPTTTAFLKRRNTQPHVANLNLHSDNRIVATLSTATTTKSPMRTSNTTHTQPIAIRLSRFQQSDSHSRFCWLRRRHVQKIPNDDGIIVRTADDLKVVKLKPENTTRVLLYSQHHIIANINKFTPTMQRKLYSCHLSPNNYSECVGFNVPLDT